LDSRVRAVPWFSNRWLYDPATGPITPEKRQQANPGWLYQRWGATASGPLAIPKLYDGHNRSFWSFGYEGMHVQRQATYTGTFPTQAEAGGDFSALLKLGGQYQIYDPLTTAPAPGGRFSRQPLTGNAVPQSRMDSIGRKIVSYWPQPNVAGTADGRQNYFKIENEVWNYRSMIARADHTFGEKHRAFLRWSNSVFDQKIRSFPTEAVGTENNPTGHRVALDDVYVFSPSLLLNLRYGLVYQQPLSFPLNRGFDVLSLGFPQSLLTEIKRKTDPAGLAFPQVNADGFSGLGGGGGSLTSAYYHTVAGTVSRFSGNHSMKLGGEFRLMRDNGFSYGNVAPYLDFGTTYTRGPLDTSPAAPIGQGLASLLLGIPTGGRVDINASRAEQSTFYAFFVQDDWRLSQRLTVNLGLRWEIESPVTERFNRSLLDFDFAAASPVEAAARANYVKSPIPEIAPANFNLRGGLTFAGLNGRPRQLWDPDRNNVAPRIGLSWQVRPLTVLRAGYGIFYGLLGVDRQHVNQSGFSQATNLIPSLDNGLTFRATLANPFPDGLGVPPGSSGGLATYLGRGVSFFNQEPCNLYMQRWSFSVQRQLPGKLVADLTYMGNRGAGLGVSNQFAPVPPQYLSRSPVRDQATIDYLGAQVTNPFAGIPEFAGTGLAGARVARSQLLRSYPHFTSVATTLPAGYSWYHSLQLDVQKRMAKGLLFQAGWTWSKLMEATSYMNDGDRRPYETVSDIDATHRFVASAIYELPFGHGRRWLSGAPSWVNRIAGDWQAQGVYEGQAGFPLAFGNAIFTGDLKNILIPVSERKAERWFNVDAGFERNNQRQLGSNWRAFPLRFSGIRGDGINNFDLSLIRNIPLREGLRVQLRMEAINAMNHVQFADPNTTPSSTAFGSVTAERGHGQRQINLMLKVLW
jgi:hypothetical protein